MIALTAEPTSLAAILESKWLGDLLVGHGTLRAALDSEVRLRLDGTSNILTERLLVAETTAAESFLTDPGTVNLRSSIQSLLGLLDCVGGRAGLRVISLSSSTTGFYANIAATRMQVGQLRPGGRDSLRIRDEVGLMSRIIGDGSGGVGIPAAFVSIPHVRAGAAGLDLSPGTSAAWRVLADDPTAAAVPSVYPPHDSPIEAATSLAHILLHEGLHTVSPLTVRDADSVAATIPGTDIQVAWLEEAIVDTLSSWPGTITSTGHALGFSVDEGPHVEWWERDHPYSAYNTTLRRLLQLAGIDPGDSTEYTGALALLRQKPAIFVPQRLARLIARTHQLDSSTIAPLTLAIRETGGDPAQVESVAAIAASHR